MRKLIILGCLMPLIGCNQPQQFSANPPPDAAQVQQQQEQTAALLRLSQSLLNSGAPSYVPVSNAQALGAATNAYYNQQPVIQNNPYAVDTRVQISSAPPVPVNCATSYSQLQGTYNTRCY